MDRFEKAMEDLKKAERRCNAELFASSIEGLPMIPVTDKNGKYLTKEEMYNMLLNGEE